MMRCNIHPDATESCNNADDNCNGYVDEGSDTTAPIGSVTFYADTDGDTFGDVNSTLVQCNPSNGYVGNSDDCDDGNVDIHPNATEVCNGIDDNCDGALDDTTDPTVAPTWYLDSDGDGDGDVSQTLTQCTMPSTHVDNTDDCNDSDATLNADDQDSDGFSTCDGDCDDNDPVANLSDVDGDGMNSCSGDCNDNDPSIYLNVERPATVLTMTGMATLMKNMR